MEKYIVKKIEDGSSTIYSSEGLSSWIAKNQTNLDEYEIYKLAGKIKPVIETTVRW